MQNTALSPVHTASDMITFVFNGELATSGDSNRWRQNVGVSSDAGQLYANEPRISQATTNRSEESISGFS